LSLAIDREEDLELVARQSREVGDEEAPRDRQFGARAEYALRPPCLIHPTDLVVFPQYSECPLEENVLGRIGAAVAVFAERAF
jgi:hypothetical protein